MTAAATFAILPFGDVVNIFGSRVGLYGLDVNIGILYAFAFGGIAFYGLMLGGWASGSKYSFLGSMRAAAQLISYEVSLGLSLVGVVIMAESLSLTQIVHAQAHYGLWFFIPQFVGFLIFLVAGFAETNRAPFDLAGSRRRARPGLQHRVRRRALRVLLLRRVPECARDLGDRGDDVLRRLAAAVRHRSPGLRRSDRGAREDVPLGLLSSSGSEPRSRGCATTS